MPSIFNLLLFIHIICGFTALTAAIGAISTKKGGRIHRLCGRIFVTGLTGIVITAIPMTIIKHDMFLFLIALFSYYFALSGWMYAKNRSGIASTLAWTISTLMLCLGFAMICYSLFHLHHNDYQANVLILFGVIASVTASADLKTYFYKNAIGNFRIVRHLSAMLGATIATTTAFTVVNFHSHPEYLAWIAPTIFITPLILWWRLRVMQWPQN